jgi:hypothetical protein
VYAALVRSLAAVVIALTAPTARADTVISDTAVGRPLVLADGALEAELVVEADLAQFAQPLSFSPDAWLGVTSRLTVGLTTSDAALDLVDDGASICVRPNPFFGCENHGAGIDARYAVTDRVAPRVRILERGIEPGKPALAFGALVRVASTAHLDLVIDPYIQLGLANTQLGNDPEIVVPVFFTWQIVRRLALTAETGYITDATIAADGFHIPLSGMLTGRVARHVEVAAQVGFTSLAGPQNNIKQREGWLIVRYLSW